MNRGLCWLRWRRCCSSPPACSGGKDARRQSAEPHRRPHRCMAKLPPTRFRLPTAGA